MPSMRAGGQLWRYLLLNEEPPSAAALRTQIHDTMPDWEPPACAAGSAGGARSGPSHPAWVGGTGDRGEGLAWNQVPGSSRHRLRFGSRGGGRALMTGQRADPLEE